MELFSFVRLFIFNRIFIVFFLLEMATKFSFCLQKKEKGKVIGITLIFTEFYWVLLFFYWV